MSNPNNPPPSQRELDSLVQNMLKQMTQRFDEMSKNIIGRVQDMNKRIDQIQKSIGVIMDDVNGDALDSDGRGSISNGGQQQQQNN